MMRDPFDLAVIGFGDTHAARHRFWRYRRDAGAGRTPDPELSCAVRDVYRALDGELGRILSAVPGDPHVVVMTDHGIGDGYPTWELMSALCRRLGYQARRDTGALDAPRRVLRAQWHRVRSRVGGASGARGADALAATDWPRTRAFPIPAHYTGLIRVDLRGREPHGIVTPGADYVALLDEIEADRRLVVDSATGQLVVERITRSADAFGGGPQTALPDLFVEWRVLQSRRVVHPKATFGTRWLGLPRPNLHSRTGLVLVAGPSLDPRGDRGALAAGRRAAVAQARRQDTGTGCVVARAGGIRPEGPELSHARSARADHCEEFMEHGQSRHGRQLSTRRRHGFRSSRACPASSRPGSA